jgi:DNA-binding MarR family transcriptional regulator
VKPGARLTAAQVRVLNAIAHKGYTSVAMIADSAGLSCGVAQHTLDALTRRNLVIPTASGYVTTPRAVRTLATQ